MECKKTVQIGGIVVLYEPHIKDFEYLKSYVNKVVFLLILDNSKTSNDKVVSVHLQNTSGQFEYVYFGENIGLSAALNRGIKLLKDKGYEWVITMDSDSSWQSDICEIYKAEISKDASVAIYAPLHLHDRSKATEYIGTKEIDWAMTSGCCFNIKQLEAMGGFNEQLFVDGLDMDYCFRVKEKGLKIIQCGNALIKHNPAETHCFKVFGLSVLKYGKASPWRYYMQMRSLTWMFLRYHKLEVVKIWFWKWFKVTFFFEGKSNYFKEMYKGVKDGITIWKEYSIR